MDWQEKQHFSLPTSVWECSAEQVHTDGLTMRKDTDIFGLVSSGRNPEWGPREVADFLG